LWRAEIERRGAATVGRYLGWCLLCGARIERGAATAFNVLRGARVLLLARLERA